LHTTRSDTPAVPRSSAHRGRTILFALVLLGPTVVGAVAASAAYAGWAAGPTITGALTYLAIQSLAGWYLWAPASADKVTRQERDADQRFLAALVEEMQEGVVTVDRAGVVRTWSPGAERMFGWLAAEAIGQPLADYLAVAIPPGDLETSAVGPPRTETRGPRKDGQEIVCGTLRFQVMHVPGHAPGLVAFTGDSVSFGGDLLFAGSIGRTDLPLGNPSDMTASLARYTGTLADDVVVYPGHGPATSIGVEKRTNPFVLGLARPIRR